MQQTAKGLDILGSEKGIALLEVIPLLAVFITLMSFGLGLFGAVHTAVLHSIAARTYSFEAFRQRTNLKYFREDGSGLNPSTAINFSKKGWRYQAVNHENDPRLLFVATTRTISFGKRTPAGDATEQTNNVSVMQLGNDRNQKISVNPIWVMVGYGMCLDANCGGN
jgi:hypothetical protein